MVLPKPKKKWSHNSIVFTNAEKKYLSQGKVALDKEWREGKKENEEMNEQRKSGKDKRKKKRVIKWKIMVLIIAKWYLQ